MIGITIIFLVVVTIGLIMAVDKPFIQQLVMKLRGRTEEITNKDASTPEGAKDYYNAVIQERESLKKQIAVTYTELEGRLATLRDELHTTQKDVMKYVQQIEGCVGGGKDEDAVSYAMKKTTAEKRVVYLKDNITRLSGACEQQAKLLQDITEDIRALKEEREETVQQLECDMQSIELQQSLSSVVMSGESERMLEKVREGAKKVREQAIGTGVVYNTSESSTERRLQEEANKREAERLVEEIKVKMGKQRG